MKKLLLSFILSVTAFSHAQAAEPVKGIMCTYEGSETTYAFAEVPTVKYVTEEGVQYVLFYVAGKESPAATFALADGVQLSIGYGEFTPIATAIEGVETEKAQITERNGRKYIQGGKLIIVGKDGNTFTIDGKKTN